MFFSSVLAFALIASGLYLFIKMACLTIRRYDKGLVIDNTTRKKRKIIISIAALLIVVGIFILCRAPKIFGAIPALFLLFACKNINYGLSPAYSRTIPSF